MAPIKGNEILDEDAIFRDDEDTSYDITELWAVIQDKKDIILTLPKDQVDLLKSGLSSKKSKETKKLKDAGLAVDSSVLTYLVYDDETTKDTDTTKLRIKYGTRTKFNISKMEIPDDSF